MKGAAELSSLAFIVELASSFEERLSGGNRYQGVEVKALVIVSLDLRQVNIYQISRTNHFIGKKLLKLG